MVLFHHQCDLRVRLLQIVTVHQEKRQLEAMTEQKSHSCLLVVGGSHAVPPLLMVLMVHYSFSGRKVGEM